MQRRQRLHLHPDNPSSSSPTQNEQHRESSPPVRSPPQISQRPPTLTEIAWTRLHTRLRSHFSDTAAAEDSSHMSNLDSPHSENSSPSAFHPVTPRRMASVLTSGPLIRGSALGPTSVHIDVAASNAEDRKDRILSYILAITSEVCLNKRIRLVSRMLRFSDFVLFPVVCAS